MSRKICGGSARDAALDEGGTGAGIDDDALDDEVLDEGGTGAGIDDALDADALDDSGAGIDDPDALEDLAAIFLAATAIAAICRDTGVVGVGGGSDASTTPSASTRALFFFRGVDFFLSASFDTKTRLITRGHTTVGDTFAMYCGGIIPDNSPALPASAISCKKKCAKRRVKRTTHSSSGFFSNSAAALEKYPRRTEPRPKVIRVM